MKGTIRTTKRVAKMTLRVRADAIPSGAEIECTDLMLQPGNSVSGWTPNVGELPWSDGVTEDGLP